jgi:hypothetical protein
VNGAAVGWALAGLAFVVGWWQYGWRGLVLAATVVVFWLLLQFSRALRVLRRASARPVGNVASAVMLHARLQPKMRLADVIALTGSLGHKQGDAPECFAWSDGGGDRVEVEFVDGRSSAWRLVRAGMPSP